MAKGFFLLSSAAVGKRMIMSPRIHEETNSVTNRLMSFGENSEAGSSCFWILTLRIFLSDTFAFTFFSVLLYPSTVLFLFTVSLVNLDLNVSEPCLSVGNLCG